MRDINRDSLPHILFCMFRMIAVYLYGFSARLSAWFWGVQLGRDCKFIGHPFFKRHPKSQIWIGVGSEFNSSPTSNFIGVNHPCMITTLKENSILKIGDNCGFSGAVIACAVSVTLGNKVRCGANTLINDTDWHADDKRAGLDAPVIIGDNVWLGANVTVLKGVTIGEGTFVGAGSVVTKSLPPYVVAAGVPARIIRDINSKESTSIDCRININNV